MKEFILKPLKLFQREKKVNEELNRLLRKNNELSGMKQTIIYFFALANFMLLMMNLIVYTAIIAVLATTPFQPPIALLRLLPLVLFLPFLYLFQKHWLPKVRQVQLAAVGVDVNPIIQKYYEHK